MAKSSAAGAASGRSVRPNSLSEPNSSTITIHDLQYIVQVKAGAKCCTTVDKSILQDVSGVFKPGMNAILGPTGSGKTSLLDILAGRKDPRGLSGTILVDGNRQPSNFKCMTGYVVQDDVVMGTLTVRENFMFSANLRLPSSLSKQIKADRVQDVVNELGLTHCADSKVGTEFIRGISGGERKRTNIGMELVISPPVLFLDEPTTGLDSSTANAVIKLLQRQGQKGRTIIFSIHQPRYTIYKCFDNLLMLALGRTVYHGPCGQALDYFSSIGYDCEEHNNPPDFFLDVINGDSSAVHNVEKTEDGRGSNGRISALTFPPEDYNDADIEMAGVGKETGAGEEQTEMALAEELAQKYLSSKQWSNIQREVEPVYKEYQRKKEHKENVQGQAGMYATSFFTQFRYTSGRNLLNIFRNPQTSVLQTVVVTIFALIVGLIYLQQDNLLPAALQNRIGAAFFIVMNQVFSNISAVELFIKEKVIFMHENSSGFYRVSVFFLSKLLFDILPQRLLPVILFSCITYFMIGFQISVAKFFIYMLTLFLTTLAASSVGFLMGSCFNIFAVGNLMMALTFVLMMVFGGLFVNINSIAVWLRWLQYLSIFRYGLNGLLINELKDLVLCREIPFGNGSDVMVLCDNTTSNEQLQALGIAYETPWDLWQNEVALFCIGMGILILSYIRLVTLKKTK